MLPQIRPARLPRMADFARILTAKEQVFGAKEGGRCFEHYLDNTNRMLRQVVDDSELAQTLLEFTGRKANWQGQPKQLLDNLNGGEVNFAA